MFSWDTRTANKDTRKWPFTLEPALVTRPLARGIGPRYVLKMDASQPSTPRSVVLVHGMWGRPGDWQWVQRRLNDRGVEVLVPDLPSHQFPDAGFLDDVEEVKAAIRSSAPPTCVAGWSYGCDVVGVAADGEENVARLVYGDRRGRAPGKPTGVSVPYPLKTGARFSWNARKPSA